MRWSLHIMGRDFRKRCLSQIKSDRSRKYSARCGRYMGLLCLVCTYHSFCCGIIVGKKPRINYRDSSRRFLMISCSSAESARAFIACSAVRFKFSTILFTYSTVVFSLSFAVSCSISSLIALLNFLCPPSVCLCSSTVFASSGMYISSGRAQWKS